MPNQTSEAFRNPNCHGVRQLLLLLDIPSPDGYSFGALCSSNTLTPAKPPALFDRRIPCRPTDEEESCVDKVLSHMRQNFVGKIALVRRHLVLCCCYSLAAAAGWMALFE